MCHAHILGEKVISKVLLELTAQADKFCYFILPNIMYYQT